MFEVWVSENLILGLYVREYLWNPFTFDVLKVENIKMFEFHMFQEKLLFWQKYIYTLTKLIFWRHIYNKTERLSV